MHKIFSCLFLSVFTFTLSAEDTPRAISLSVEDLSGKILSDQPVVEFFGNESQSVEVYQSEDEKFSVGVFGMVVEDEKNGTTRYEDFPINEFMYFLEGKMTLIDDDGIVTEAGPGEVLFIPRGWSGTRITSDIRKVSVVYREEAQK